MNKKLIIVTFLFFIVNSCKNQVQSEVVVYSNTFESNNLSGIKGGTITQFNSTSVIGQYNNSGFTLNLNDLPRHHLITITLDLYLHDSWDGNKLGPDGPDIWQMLVDGNTYIDASFSNSECSPGNFCPPQSYPLNYPNNYSNPKTGAHKTDLPGVCHLVNNTNGTTLYKIVKTFKHSNNTLILQCLDKLVQTNDPIPKCDESWSVDNIIIKAIAL
jgi:hypothetical protein